MRITSNTLEREGILETPQLPSCLLWGRLVLNIACFSELIGQSLVLSILHMGS
jgi:hypothetical protein